jgi:hypothetical protein
MPPNAVHDLIEWPFQPTGELEFNYVLNRETSMNQFIAADPNAKAMHDDLPVNEYTILRVLKGSQFDKHALMAWYDHTMNP